MSARFLFTFAVQMQAVVLGWRMYELTRDPLYLGFIGLAEALPALSLAMYAGYVVDRSRPLVIYKRLVAVSFTSGLIFLLAELPQFGLDASQQVIALFSSSFLTGVARGFSQPAMYAIVPRIVPRENLSQAAAWMTTAMQIARISGPAVGGLLFGWLGKTVTASVVCLSLIGASISLALIKTSPAANQKAKSESMKVELFSGAKFVFGHKVLLPAMALDMVSVLFGGVTALLPIYASDILMIGPKGLGILRAAPALGAAATSFVLSRFTIKKTAGPWLFVSVAGFGVCILVFAVSRDFTLSLMALAVSGAFDSISMVIRSSAVQLVSPDHMRGRISAINSIFIGSSNELGELESGLAAKFLGAVPAAILGGVVCIITVGVVAWRSPTLRRLNLADLERENRL